MDISDISEPILREDLRSKVINNDDPHLFYQKHVARSYEVKSLTVEDLWRMAMMDSRSGDIKVLKESSIMIVPEGKELVNLFRNGVATWMPDKNYYNIKCTEVVEVLYVTGSLAHPEVTFMPTCIPTIWFTKLVHDGGVPIHWDSNGVILMPNFHPDPMEVRLTPEITGIELSPYSCHKRKLLLQYLYEYEYPTAPDNRSYQYLKDFSTMGLYILFEDQVKEMVGILSEKGYLLEAAKQMYQSNDSRYIRNYGIEWRRISRIYEFLRRVSLFISSILDTREVNPNWKTPYKFELFKIQLDDLDQDNTSLRSELSTVIDKLEETTVAFEYVEFDGLIHPSWQIGIPQCANIIRTRYPKGCELWNDDKMFARVDESPPPKSPSTPSVEPSPIPSPSGSSSEPQSSAPISPSQTEPIYEAPWTSGSDSERPVSPAFDQTLNSGIQSLQLSHPSNVHLIETIESPRVESPLFGRGNRLPTAYYAGAIKPKGRGQTNPKVRKSPIKHTMRNWGESWVTNDGRVIHPALWGERVPPHPLPHPPTLAEFLVKNDYRHKYRYISPVVCGLCLEPFNIFNIDEHFNSHKK